jgi:hypothetical protein
VQTVKVGVYLCVQVVFHLEWSCNRQGECAVSVRRRARQAEPDDGQSETGRAKQAERDRQSETGTAIQIERDRHIQTGSVGQIERDR